MTNIGREYYKKMKIHKGTGPNSTPIPSITTQKLFYTEGEYAFGELDFLGDGWIKIHPIVEKEQVVAMIVREGEKAVNNIPLSKREENYEKTLIYENKDEKVMALMYIDCKNHYHEIDIIARKSLEENSAIINNTRSLLEMKLKCKLEERLMDNINKN
jgi:hypothetical protein